MDPGSRRAIFAAFTADLGIAVAKFVGFVLTGAVSMLAEALHSVADTSNQGLLFLGAARAKKGFSEDHPFGHGRERYFWGFVVALVIFSLGALFSMVEGVQKLLHPHELGQVGVAIVILLVAMVLESFSFRTAVKHSRERKEEAGSWWRFIRVAKVPELPVILLEDLGALIGLSFALVGVVLADVTGNARFDAMGSLAIGVLLGTIAVVLMIEMKGLLIGEAASAAELDAIEQAINADGHVKRLIHIRTQHLAPDQLLVGCKVELDRHLDFQGVVDAINDVEQRIQDAVPHANLIYVEPDITHEPR
ncbi:MAG: cation diffusion facilitator family transporter [Actinomycetota bacterium]|nr:cation diffusion facilitator family transporter [Actinomycetota bacterium]